jgi:hypothetical protein
VKGAFIGLGVKGGAEAVEMQPMYWYGEGRAVVRRKRLKKMSISILAV